MIVSATFFDREPLGRAQSLIGSHDSVSHFFWPWTPRTRPVIDWKVPSASN